MAISAQQSYDEIVEFINNNGNVYACWYCGITSSINQRLFDDHNVKSGYIYRECFTSEDARNVEKALINLGCDGGSGGGGSNSKFVYAYQKVQSTIQ